MGRARRPWFDEWLPLAAIAVAVGTALALRVEMLPDADGALVVMGFDPDRARLIDGLVVAFLTSAVARLVIGSALGSAVGGCAAFAVVYEHVLRAETSSALEAGGIDGRFDPGGWVLSVLTLAVVVAVVAAAASLLAGHVRTFALDAARDVAAARRSCRPTGALLARPTGLAVALVLLAVSLPVFGDMVNFTPDVRMRAGAPAPPPLVGAGADGGTRAGDGGGNVGGSATTRIDAPAGVLAAATPWLAWRPSGAGRIVHRQFPAPWSGGRSTIASVTIYLPPGYDASPGRRYPVVYEAPFAPGPLVTYLDGYFTSGDAPPEIMVFASESGGPYPDSECADSYDGRERFESFVATTVVRWVDSHYRTIAGPKARTVYGPSQGGFCAAMLLLRHPDVFGQAIALSGYYVAGVSSGQTVNAYRPFGHDAALIAAHSPLRLVPSLSAAVRTRLFLVLGGEPAQPFYGPQLIAFDNALTKAGIAHAVLQDSIPHSWRQFEQDLPAALHLIALRQVTLGVFGPA
jgi:esterase/lipase superfamily enzyme